MGTIKQNGETKPKQPRLNQQNFIFYSERKRVWKTLASIAFFFGSILAIVYFQGTPAASAATCSYPAQVLNLTNWKQTLPTGSSKSPKEILQTLLSSFSLAPFFQANTDCNAVVFRAPVNGVTTSGSGYPRSELREMKNNGADQASWSTTSGTHTMFIDQAITAVPKTKKHVVAGQIHDASDDVIVIRLEYPKLFVDINGTTGPTLDANYTLGKRFTVKFEAANGKIKIYYNGNQTPVYTLSKSTSGNYFKAGAYTQSNCTKETVCDNSNFGEVAIYDLKVTHSDSNSVPTPTPIPEPTPVPTPTPSPSPEPTPAPAPTGTSFEAESGAITSPMQIASVSSASNGKYIVQTTDTGTGVAQYLVNIPTSGKYQIRAKVIAPNGSSNSVYYILDNGSSNTWNMPDTLTDWTWTDGPVATLSQGTHTFAIKKREKNTKIDAFEFKLQSSATVATPSNAMDGTLPFESEIGTASGGMHILSNDSTASNGKYVQADSSGSMKYQLNIPVSGTYRLAGWIKAGSGSSDSFNFSVDGKSAVTWTLTYPSSNWTYDVDDGHTFSLSAGTHTLSLNYREAGAKIDKLVFVKQ
jgi:hypothetical protein